jgi:Spy/CpxP family protein refolding chaperone
MRWSSGVIVGALVLAGAVVAACEETTGQGKTPAGAGAPEGVPADSVAEEEKGPAADELRAFHRHHHVGFIGFALMSIPSLGVSPTEQAAVEKIRLDMDARFRPEHDAEAVLLNVVADGVAAGTIDVAKVDAATAKLAEVSTQMDDATNDALNQLHAVLTPPERDALALKVQAHFMIWHKANADLEAQPNQEQEGGHIHHLAQQIGLSPDQVQKIDASFTESIKALAAARGFDRKAADDHLTAFVAAFPAEHFDAKTLTTADKANSSVAMWGAMRMVRMYEAMVPVLTPDQRTKLAALLREHATKLEAK